MNIPRLRTVLFIVGVLAASCLAAVLAERWSIRVDARGGAVQRLAPRTLAVLRTLESPVEVLLAIDNTARDPRLNDAVADVVDALAAASPVVTLTRFDTASAAGREKYAAAIDRLTERDRPTLDAAALAAAAAAAQAVRSADALDAALPAFTAAAAGASSAAEAQALRDRAAELRQIAAELRSIAGSADAAGDTARLLDPMPAVERLRLAMTALRDRLGRVAEEARSLAAAGGAGVLRGAAAALATIRDDAALTADDLSRVRTPDASRIAEAVAAGEALIVSRLPAPGDTAPALAGVDLDAVIPTGAFTATDAIDRTRRASEQALFAALAATSRRDRPIVVLVHGQWGRFAGAPPFSAQLLLRLASSGIDVLDWPVATGEAEPSALALDPEQRRPVVYVVLAAETWSTPIRRPDGSTIPSGLERHRRVADAASTLLEEGRRVLIALQPSVLPTFGDADPLAPVLARLGVTADVGRPLLSRTSTPRGPAVDATTRIVGGAGTGHPVAAAVAGLPFSGEWSVGLGVSSPDRVTPILWAEPDDARWAESQWLEFMRTRPDQRPLLRPQPEFGPGDGQARVMLAAACASEADPWRRAVVVGGVAWMLDPAWADTDPTTAALRNPGNIELLEASIAWLADQDGLIGASASARSQPLIRPITPATASILRWAVIAGIPAVVLVIGAVWRVRRW